MFRLATRSFPIVSVFFLIASLSTSLWSMSFQPVSQEELKMTSEPKAPGAPAIILFREVDRDDRGNTAHEDVYLRIKILTEEGRKYADIEIPFFKETGTIVNIHARTIQPDGAIVDFNGKAFDKSIVKARGLKYMAKTFTMSDVQVGCVIEYYYTEDLSENSVFNSHWVLSDQLFTRKAKFTLIDADYGFGSYHSKTEVKGNVIHYSRTFEVKDLSVPVAKADELKKFYRLIAGDERNIVVLKAGAK